MLSIQASTVEEMKALIESGDLSLAERRATFIKKAGRATTLNDELLTYACVTEDDDDDEFVANVEKVEKGEYVIATDASPSAA